MSSRFVYTTILDSINSAIINKVLNYFICIGVGYMCLSQLLDLYRCLVVFSCKWTDADIDMMMNSVKRFCTDLNGISETIKTRTM